MMEMDLKLQIPVVGTKWYGDKGLFAACHIVQLRHLQARTERDHHLQRTPKLVSSPRLPLIR